MSIPEIKVCLSREDAVVPAKAHITDSGFDVTLTHVIKTVGDVTFYGTGVHVCPPAGFYFILAPRSSISKTGYSLANSVGIIDQDYRGEIIVALRKADKTSSDLELPIKMAQLIPTPVYHMTTDTVSKFETNTERGEGGFGSTGK